MVVQRSRSPDARRLLVADRVPRRTPWPPPPRRSRRRWTTASAGRCKGRLRAEAERQAQQAATNEARTGLESRRGAAAEDPAMAETRDAPPGAVGSGMDQAESEFREALRLKEIERRTRSLQREMPTPSGPIEPHGWAIKCVSVPPLAGLEGFDSCFLEHPYDMGDTGIETLNLVCRDHYLTFPIIPIKMVQLVG